MSSLLDMAKDTEQRLKTQASATEQMLRREFSEHERRVSEALRSSEQKISAAIAGHTEGMNAVLESHRLNVYRMVRRKWVSIVITTGLLVGMSGGFLWSLGDDIRTSQRELKRLNADIEAQRDTLAKLNAKTWGMTFREDEKGRFLIFPRGTQVDTGWTQGTGKAERNAVKVKLVKD